MSTVPPAGISYRFIINLLETDGSVLDISGYATAVVRLKRITDADYIELAGVVDDPTTGEYYAEITSTEFTGEGGWAVWGVVTWASGRVVKTHAAQIRVIKEGLPYSG